MFTVDAKVIELSVCFKHMLGMSSCLSMYLKLAAQAYMRHFEAHMAYGRCPACLYNNGLFRQN